MKKEQSQIRIIFDKRLGKNLSFEHIIFLCGATAGIILSLFGAVSNFVMGLHTIAVIIPIVNFIIDVACVVYSIKTTKWRLPAVIVYIFAGFVLFPFLWFTTGGTMSSSLPLVIGLGVVLAIVFHGKMRHFLFFSTLILFSGFIIFELYYPGHFIEYPSRQAWYWDVLFGFVLSYLASGGLAFYTVMKYNATKKEAEDLIVKLDTISQIDSLTGIFNRRSLMIKLDSEMREAYDNGRPLTLCIIDIDFFKNINDTYGHLCGDEVLIKMSSIIRDCLSEKELLGRYGGEEFIIIFSNCDLLSAIEKMERIYEKIKLAEWPHGESITISCGMSKYIKGLSYSKFLENADSQLYRAKEKGRNRIEYRS